ncbi:MOSC domain-containing protein [Nocardioides sp. L-11A]|uniref:MOSC domain-containing protein n=1 Tax=Nocardioides sp. L-11A TaxID=3043848 RepID=UPI002499C35C|nr:MOSC domain-containing protein [Nocardioides sp. L-11A]
MTHAAERVRALFRYPVKSMAGESLADAELGWHGLAGDRRWAFVRPDHEAHGFPWHTPRQEPRMVLFAPRLRDPERPDASAVDVRTPEGEELALTDPALPDRLGAGLRLMRLHRGTFDSMPVSLIGTATVAEICSRAGVDPTPARLRANLLVETRVPFVEEGWVGRTVRIGAARLRMDRPISRCVVIDVDPGSGRRTPGLLRTLAAERDTCAGVYATVVTPGPVRVGDLVHPETGQGPG